MLPGASPAQRPVSRVAVRPEHPVAELRIPLLIVWAVLSVPGDAGPLGRQAEHPEEFLVLAVPEVVREEHARRVPHELPVTPYGVHVLGGQAADRTAQRRVGGVAAGPSRRIDDEHLVPLRQPAERVVDLVPPALRMPEQLEQRDDGLLHLLVRELVAAVVPELGERVEEDERLVAARRAGRPVDGEPRQTIQKGHSRAGIQCVAHSGKIVAMSKARGEGDRPAPRPTPSRPSSCAGQRPAIAAASSAHAPKLR